MAVAAAALGESAEQPADGPAVRIVDFDPHAETKVLAGLLYPHLGLPLDEVRRIAGRMPAGQRRELLNEHVRGRGSRHKRPGRAFEMADYTVEFCANFGVYKDLQRHRLTTQQRQPLSTQLGYTIPPELVGGPFEGRFRECMAAADGA